ncbi:bile salt sulfotransferase 2-like isoform X2 [Perognathus longimembris pacificus]|uniref:bile salt sulfotransferase 2-like isoform X2 n=1 Tax=Perognathus longimembris pacificus TaxID=214514 RepID=UPI002019B6D1|nr:bile salt sulfotransferase 2-like isoform X2 [Perognathus longimembris pacificus]
MAQDYVWYDGIAFPVVDYKPEILKAAHEKFVVKDEDIMLVSYPKSGTHWLIEIISLIHTKGDPKWVRSVNTYDRSPWIETESGNTTIVNRKEGPPLISSHLPIQLFPKSFFTSKAKLIYVIRNPKDVLISGYYFWSSTNLAKKPESLEQYFEWFLRGHVPYGSWFDHVRGWLSLREKENVLVLCYEEMRKALPGTGRTTSPQPRPKPLRKPSGRRWQDFLQSCFHGTKSRFTSVSGEMKTCAPSCRGDRPGEGAHRCICPSVLQVWVFLWHL